MAPAKSKMKMTLGEFLGEFPGEQASKSWADEMESFPITSDSRPNEQRSYGGASFGDFDRSSSRGYAVRETCPLPTKPPYTAHLGNLSFDATEVDIQDFFANCSVTSVRIVEDKFERKPKGFGYVGFESLDGLKNALELSGSQFQGRNIFVSVADPPKDRPEPRELNDWTRKGPSDPPSRSFRSLERASSNFEARSDIGSERGDRRRPGFEGGVRDLETWERKGPTPQTLSLRDSGRIRSTDGVANSHANISWGERRSQDGSRPPHREFSNRMQYDRQPPMAELDNQWRSNMRPDVSAAATPDTSMPSSPAAVPAVPASRRKLNLTKRTVPNNGPTRSSAAAPDSRRNPFGDALPIDTAAREKLIEENRMRERNSEVTHVDETSRKEAPSDSKENKADSSPNYTIIRRGDNDNELEINSAVGSPNGHFAQEKASEPKLPSKDSKEPTEDYLRGKSGTSIPSIAKCTGDGEDEQGWSKVFTKSKNNRKGANQGSRVAAS